MSFSNVNMAGERVLKSLSDRLLNLDGMIQNKNDEIDTYQFVESMKNNNTKSKTKSDLKRVQDFLRSIGEERQLHDIPPEELNVLLARLFINIRKKTDNSEYEPDTLKGIQSSIHRHLTENAYQANILQDLAFKHSRDVIASKRKYLKGQGFGNKKQRSDPFTDEEVLILRQKGLLGQDNPESLINALWLNNTVHFGLRGRQEHMTMLWGDIELNATSTGVEYLAFTERCTKTRNGIASDPRAFTPKMFEQPGDEHCPVNLYKLYVQKRHEEMLKTDSQFYAAINPNYGKSVKSGSKWFINGTMGKNKIGQIAKVMSQKANLSGNHTNHSARKTSITKLLEANVAPTDVAQLSGHKNVMSLNHYNTVSLSRQEHMSNVLHNVNPSNAAATVQHSSHEEVENVDPAYDSDEELIIASQEIEETLKTIQTYEQNKIPSNAKVIDLPIVHNADGSVQVQDRFNPDKFFVNCTFNSPVNIVFK